MGYVYALFIGIFIGVMISTTQVYELRNQVQKLERMKSISWLKEKN